MKDQLIAVLAAVAGVMVMGGCQSKQKYPTLGSIERLDPRFDKLVARDAVIELLVSEKFDWAEGPVWIRSGEHLLFSDVPRNVIYRWKEGEEVREHIKPSGYTGSTPRGGEPGSNGLTLDVEGRLISCEHGDRRVARLEKDGKTKTTLASHYQGKRFNSPNDLCYKSNGDLYFTDPPYGLEGNVNDPKKEIPFQGVYRLGRDGQITLLTRDLSRPNGIAFSPDEKTLYINISDPNMAHIMAYEVLPDGTIANGKVLFDATAMFKAGRKGLPDGLKVDKDGNLWATGPGGVLVIGPDGKHLGTLDTGVATANCGWGEDGSVLYITADMHLCRVKTLTRGKMPGFRD